MGIQKIENPLAQFVQGLLHFLETGFLTLMMLGFLLLGQLTQMHPKLPEVPGLLDDLADASAAVASAASASAAADRGPTMACGNSNSSTQSVSVGIPVGSGTGSATLGGSVANLPPPTEMINVVGGHPLLQQGNSSSASNNPSSNSAALGFMTPPSDTEVPV